MAYLSTLWLVDSTNKQLCQYESTTNTITAKYVLPIPDDTENKTKPCHVLVSTDKINVYILSPTGFLFKFNTLKKAITKIIKVEPNCSGIAEGVNVINNSVPIFISNYSDNSVSVIIKDRIVYNINVGLGPKDIIVNTNGFGFVCNELEHTISVLSIFKDRYISYKKIHLPSHPLDIASDNKNILSVICKDGFLYKLDPVTPSEVAPIDVGKGCIRVAIDQDNIPWVLNRNGMVTKVHNNNTLSSYYTIDKPFSICTGNDRGMYIVSKHNALVRIQNSDGSISKTFTSSDTSLATLGDFTGMRTKLSIIPLDFLMINEEELKKLKEKVEGLITAYTSADDFPNPLDNPNLSDTSILLDKTNNTAYTYDKKNKKYNMLYGSAVTSITYDSSSSDNTNLNVKKEDGTEEDLSMDAITNNVMAKNNTITNDSIDSLF